MAADLLATILASPKVIAELGKISLKCLDIIAKRLAENQSALATLLQKSDESLLREFFAGFQALGDAISSSVPASRERLLTLAEGNLYRTSPLNPKLTIGGKSNSYWMALSHYGLAVVCTLRGDELLAAKHTLRIIEADPRLGRTQLVPELFHVGFEPACLAIYQWKEAETQKLKEKTFSGDVAASRLSAGGIGVLGAGGLLATVILSGGRVPVNTAAKSLSDKVGKDWNQATPEYFREIALGELQREFEHRLDEQCRQLASRAIAQIR